MTNQTQHRSFLHAENAGGYKTSGADDCSSRAADEHQPSCFGLGGGERVNAGRAVAVRSTATSEARPSL